MIKLVLAIVKDVDALAVSDALVEQQYRVTRVASTGGFLRRGRVTLLIGVGEESLEDVFQIIQDNCQEPEPGQYKATVFVVPAEDFVQIG